MILRRLHFPQISQDLPPKVTYRFSPLSDECARIWSTFGYKLLSGAIYAINLYNEWTNERRHLLVCVHMCTYVYKYVCMYVWCSTLFLISYGCYAKLYASHSTHYAHYTMCVNVTV